MHPLLNIAARAARAAGHIIMRSLQHIEHLEVTSKGRNDFVSDVDKLAEQEIINTIRRAYPDHAILAEESGESGESDTVWIIDPLDGTTNFLHGYPHFCVSIGIKVKGKLMHGVVYDPVREEMFTASRGDGAQLNDRRIRVSKQKTFEGALLTTGFPFKYPEHHNVYHRTFKTLFPQVVDIRRTGSAALDLAYLAAGRVDGYWEIGLAPWDMAAGALLVEEAGGVITDFIGGDNYMAHGNVVVGTLPIQAAILHQIKPHLPETLQR